jgi:hypothetical protein
MHRNHHIFAQAIEDKKKIRLTFFKNADSSSQVKVFGPLFYAPPRVGREPDRYYLWDFERNNVSGLLPSKIVSMELTEETFDPRKFISLEGNLPENKARQHNDCSTMDSEQSIPMEPMCEKNGDITELAMHLVKEIRKTYLSERERTDEQDR